MKSVRLSNFNVVFADPSIAIVTYSTAVKAVSDGKEMSATYKCGSVWLARAPTAPSD